MTVTGTRLALHGGAPAVPPGAVAPWPRILPVDRDAVLRVLDRGVMWGVDAPETTALQREWSHFVRARYCLATNSGTAALHMAVAAVGVQPGDEVVTTAYSWTSSATCVLHHNAIPVFVDIEPTTYTIDPAAIEAAITGRTRAILVVHLHGLAADMDAVLAVAARHGLPVIEDCCQAHGAEFDGRRVGTFGTAAAFSLNGGKLLSAGEGGLFVTRDKDVWQAAARVQQFGETRDPGGPRDFDADAMGWMYRMPELTAAFARSQLGRLAETIEATRANAAALTASLSDVPRLVLPHEPAGRRHAYYRYPIRLDVPGERVPTIRAALAAEGVPLGRPDFVLPGMRLFQRRRGYGRGCPWTCGHAGPARTYDAADFPEACRARDHIVQPLGLTPPNDGRLMAHYAAAFTKVMREVAA
ncbi:DegT/DnrJ/EryC1/StrS family aminotransferase [Virgisporangium aurantiacum]|uniref:Aminotransferase DegT n=1 Tax=Virgisporangium aurantiacum TaxID=175570 RepID=A0A8J4EA15_9ACTN|nr:DegT/DnrJ/EryC1/StrS family aminotransferase [Virgisporangium aurantiacum]GIJ64302.1 aminotransferase DegT [Virgisporangium aurantiacum]